MSEAQGTAPRARAAKATWKSNVACRHFLKGYCMLGGKCRFHHPATLSGAEGVAPLPVADPADSSSASAPISGPRRGITFTDRDGTRIYIPADEVDRLKREGGTNAPVLLSSDLEEMVGHPASEGLVESPPASPTPPTSPPPLQGSDSMAQMIMNGPNFVPAAGLPAGQGGYVMAPMGTAFPGATHLPFGMGSMPQVAPQMQQPPAGYCVMQVPQMPMQMTMPAMQMAAQMQPAPVVLVPQQLPQVQQLVTPFGMQAMFPPTSGTN
eukprot:TRINITY_DN16719_c0_g1_i1.p1 TRINITY_DN16719_c0_g1~~TRINITY_DN16719_c0_g1_i1.p1  ORF type:complete len:266 (+),score=50.02 TRINITY_DN16719_c0_g1_i1:3-800(+)